MTFLIQVLQFIGQGAAHVAWCDIARLQVGVANGALLHMVYDDGFADERYKYPAISILINQYKLEYTGLEILYQCSGNSQWSLSQMLINDILGVLTAFGTVTLCDWVA